jgi:putative aldouronate transport system permease protein
MADDSPVLTTRTRSGVPRLLPAQIIRGEWRHLLSQRELLILALPAMLMMLIFDYLPMIGNVIAFTRFRYDRGIFGSEWVGFRNFEFFFTSQAAVNITRNTVLYNMAFIIITLVIALSFAVLLNELPRKWAVIYQTMLFLPFFLSWVVVSYVTTAFLDFRHGYANQLLASAGQSPVRWYFEPEYWPYILNIVHLWKSVGFSTLVYYAGIIGIDTTYYEAARVDGATKWHMVRHITIPLLMPLVIILFILALGNIFRGDFGLFFFIPNNSSFLYGTTDIIDTYVYRALTQVADMGMGTAVGLYQSTVGLITVVLANWVVRRVSRDYALW